MKKSVFFAAVLTAALLICHNASAQTDIQTFYDFGRKHCTTTIEGFYGDKWGNTFFFVDYDYNAKNSDGVNQGVSGSYCEIERCLNFWQNTALAPLSAHVEYKGGVNFGYQNFLFGADWFLHNKDFTNTFNFKLLYQTFNNGATSDLPLQFTFVWGMQNLFGLQGLTFKGFLDLWGQNVTNFSEADPLDSSTIKNDKFVMITEPQLWYNVGRHFGVENLHIGTEIEISLNFAGYHGLHVRPCLGTKWIF